MGMRDTNKQELRVNNLQREREAKERRKLNPEPKMKRRQLYKFEISVRGRTPYKSWCLAYSEEQAKKIAEEYCSACLKKGEYEILNISLLKKGEGK